MSFISENIPLNNIGKILEEKYSNIRFLFQIDFSEDDYSNLKKLFQNDVLLQTTYFDKNFFFSYFKTRPFNRIPFLLLIIGFVRYEYLDAKNGSNFFSNFLENILNNEKAKVLDFRNQIIDYFFKWRGISSLEEEGLYIFSLQNKGVSLKLKNCGKQKYLNSFLYHAGSICNNDDLKTYLRIIKFLSEKIDIRIEFTKEDITNLYKQIDFKIYNNNVEKFFDILTIENIEIQKYYFDFIKQSIYLLKKQNYIGMFDLPIYIKNYLLFTGVYGKEINKINLIESDFLYQNEEIIFRPSFKNIYNQFEVLSFKIGDKFKIVNKQYDNYIEDDFEDFYISIKNPKEAIKIEMYINEVFFKSFEIELFKNKFILLDNDFNIKSLNNTKEIDIPKSDEGEKYYILTEDILELKEIMNKNLDSLFLYEVLLDGEISSIIINNIEYEISFQSKFDSQIEFRDDEFIYFSNLPNFILSKKDEYRFEAINIFSNERLSYQEFKNFNKSIGKFEINIGFKSYKIIFIKGFEIVKWFNWYEKDKTIKIALENKNIKTNHSLEEVLDNKRVLTFDIQKLTNPILVFNQINGENIHINIKEPEILLFLIDKRKNITNVTSKQNNIKLSKLKEFKKLKVILKNFPQKIKFENAQIEKNIVEINHSLNEYSLSVKNIIESFENSQKSNVSIKLRNKYNYINIANIINDTQIDKVEKNDDFIKISDVEFLMSNYKSLEVYIDNIAYKIKEIYQDSPSGFTDFYISMEERRQTKRENKIKRSFTNIEKNGLYVKACDIKYNDSDEI
ncbi:hypothetical protein N5U18_04225 [Aliarcobacter butzleri]|uniref:hypothetical protein n=1 Tax=Aliarcobacter butzleri TaxID=28197 RepID=UPI0021B3DA51|nr:hypothetical protein [Aliarcobacter butzleri]MCT7547685.1 hypothetical protein [Aliarcobacter butzleri]